MAVKKKIVLLGDSAVGKTSLIRRYVYDQFEGSYVTTIGAKVTRKEMAIEKDGSEVELNLIIHDIIGRAGYMALHARTFAGVQGAILVSDLTRKGTLNALESYWIPLLFQVVDNVPLVFTSNKSDLTDEIAYKPTAIENIASRYNIGIEGSLQEGLKSRYVTSAKTGDNVEKAFESLGHLMMSENAPRDPIKELHERLIAEGIYRQSDRKTLIGAADSLIVDFCEGLEDDRVALLILRQEFARAGVDVRSPSKEGLLKAVEYLAESESEFKDEDHVLRDKERRLQLVKSARTPAR